MWIPILIVLATLGGLQASISMLGARYKWSAETMRKLVHVGMGLVCATFPWLFHAIWPVLTLAFLASGWLLASRLIGPIRRALGAALGGVERQSNGDVAFCVGVAIVFCLAYDQPLLYITTILILTFADAAAALVGSTAGRNRYRATSGAKSLEGSMAFAITAFAVVALALAIGTTLAPATVLILAALVACTGMLVEAFSVGGSDNLLIPLVSLAVLKSMIAQPPLALALMFIVLLGSTVITFQLSREEQRWNSSNS